MAADGITADVNTNGVLEVGGWLSGRLDSAGQRAWYRVHLMAGNSYFFSMAGSTTGQGTLRDPLLYLYDPAGELLSQNDDSGGQINSRLTFNAPASGYYFLGAGAFQDAQTGTFQLAAGSYQDDYTIRSPGRLAVGGSQPGNLEVLADTDWFRVDLSAGSHYLLSVQGQDTGQGTLQDPYLYVYDASGNSVAHADDGGVRRNSLLDFTPTSGGTYFLAVGAYQDASSGTYQVGAEVAQQAITVSPAPQQSLIPDSQVSGEIASPGGEQRYRLELSGGQTYCFDLMGESSGQGSLADPYLYLYDASGARVLWDDDGGRGLDSRLVFTAWSGGTYYLAAAGFASDQTGSFQLGAFAVPAPSYEQAASQTPLTAFGARQGSIDSPGQSDWVALALEAANTYLISLQPAAGEGGLPDPELRLLDANGLQVASARGQGTTGAASLAFTPQGDGVYYVDAGAFGQNDAGRYLLSIVGRQVRQFNNEPASGDGSLANPLLPLAANPPSQALAAASPLQQAGSAALADPGREGLGSLTAPAGGQATAQMAAAPQGTC